MREVHNRQRKKAEDGTIEWVYDSEPKKCKYCQKQFYNHKGFQQHVLRSHVRPQAAAGTSTGLPAKVARTDSAPDELEGAINLSVSSSGDPVSTVPGMNIRYRKCPDCDFRVIKRSAMDLHWRVNHPDGPAMPKIMTTELEMDPSAPFPEVQWHYEVKVEGLRNHDFGTKFVDLRVSFNNGLEDEPITSALQILFKILNNIYELLTRNA
ncbi:MAG: hypothetical protein GY847_27815, partial [Proteobacteria bacterium]|nr:hypothetical protein [Pseudomonadota bacterium]